MKRETKSMILCEKSLEELGGELEMVNQFTKKPLVAEDVFLFAVRLCDNLVDRDGEYFDRETLEQLAPMFVGKTGIFDHAWTAKGQAARIYRTEVVTEGEVLSHSGEISSYLKGYAYMLRGGDNDGLIAEIEAGIKKEVSVSVAVSRRECSICGNSIEDRLLCQHTKGEIYDGRTCVVKLCEPTDAYEWSFVAVPAQAKAGVMKAMEQATKDLFYGVTEEAEVSMAVKKLQKEALMGKRYMKALREDVLKLAMLAEHGVKPEIFQQMLSGLEEDALLKLKKAYGETVGKKYPMQTQLGYGKERKAVSADREFLI